MRKVAVVILERNRQHGSDGGRRRGGHPGKGAEGRPLSPPRNSTLPWWTISTRSPSAARLWAPSSSRKASSSRCSPPASRSFRAKDRAVRLLRLGRRRVDAQLGGDLRRRRRRARLRKRDLQRRAGCRRRSRLQIARRSARRISRKPRPFVFTARPRTLPCAASGPGALFCLRLRAGGALF